MMKKPRRKPSASTVQSPLETYLREINETPLLSPDDEQALAIAIGEGNVRARDRMVRANLRLVVNIARGYTGKGLGLQDLIEEGNLGLLRAVEGFDPAMGTRFSTYASYWIKQSIKRALINTAKTIRIPAYMVELLSKWRRASTRLAEELGRTPTPEEIARVLGLPRKKLPIIKKAIRIYNLTPQTDQADAGWSLGEMVMDERARTPEDEMVEHDNLLHVLEQLETMDQREATVLRMRFGLDDHEPRTLKEIGETLGLTRERVRQIETEALNKLAESLEGARP
jgi:RNA polymerase primary sigma factor